MSLLIHKNKGLVLTLFLILNCQADKELESSNDSDPFNEAIEKTKKCTSQDKPTIDIKNGTGESGLAKKISTYLNKECYEVYAGNFENSNVPHTFIQVKKGNDMIAEELKKILGENIEVRYKEPAIWDMTLVIGKDYEKLTYEIE